MNPIQRVLVRGRRALAYSRTLLAALADPARRHLLHEVLWLARALPGELDGPLPQALQRLTPAAQGDGGAATLVQAGDAQPLDPETIRQIVDAATAFGAGRPLGICLRRSLLRYHFLRRAQVPVVVHFGARRRDDAIGGHAWLTLHGQPYHEPPENYRNFVVMFSYPDGLAGPP